MNWKGPIKKLMTILIWCGAGGAVLAILIAAINAKSSSSCSGLEVEINGDEKARILSKEDVFLMLESIGLKNVQGRKMNSIDLLKTETVLKRNAWIKEAQLYFDNNQVLKVRIREREPFARLFTTGGNSFLIDSSGIMMGIPEKTAFRLPVFTGYPSEKFGLRKDSVLGRQIRDLAGFINGNSFWAAQIQEIAIGPSGSFRMIPLIGDQTIEFGDGSNYADKFRRLMVFYREVLVHTGFEKYTGLNVAYSGQVIATKKGGAISRADSLQALKNVMDMIRAAHRMETDTGRIRETRPLEKNTVTEQTLQGYDLPGENEPADSQRKN